MEIDLTEILKRAIMCDQRGRLLEAECLYKEGSNLLLEIVDDEHDIMKKKILYDRIAQYKDRVEQIGVRLKKRLARGKRVANVNIQENSVGNSYQSVFDKYLNQDVREVIIDEPHLYHTSHFQNLIIFLETLLRKCTNLKYIRVVTKPLSKNAIKQAKSLDEIKRQMSERGITVQICMDSTLHSARIVLSNGFILKTSHGLHFFKEHRAKYPIGLGDYDFRRCLATEFDVWRTQAK